jgi:hypothetical protein
MGLFVLMPGPSKKRVPAPAVPSTQEAVG